MPNSRGGTDLQTAPRLPKAQQRRLDKLIEKGTEAQLSASESAELEAMLEHVDRQTFWMLARLLARRPGAVAGTRRRGRLLHR
jgi:hypothetical protein